MVSQGLKNLLNQACPTISQEAWWKNASISVNVQKNELIALREKLAMQLGTGLTGNQSQGAASGDAEGHFQLGVGLADNQDQRAVAEDAERHIQLSIGLAGNQSQGAVAGDAEGHLQMGEGLSGNHNQGAVVGEAERHTGTTTARETTKGKAIEIIGSSASQLATPAQQLTSTEQVMGGTQQAEGQGIEKELSIGEKIDEAKKKQTISVVYSRKRACPQEKGLRRSTRLKNIFKGHKAAPSPQKMVLPTKKRKSNRGHNKGADKQQNNKEDDGIGNSSLQTPPN